jgi:hypothetical protein
MNIIAEETYLEVVEETEELVILEEIVKNDIIEVGNIIIKEISGAGRIEGSFDFDDVNIGFKSIGFIPSGRRIVKSDLIIETEFDGLTSINIGDDDAQGRLINAQQNNPGIANTSSIENNILYSVLTEIRAYFTGLPSQGAGTIIIYYS